MNLSKKAKSQIYSYTRKTLSIFSEEFLHNLKKDSLLLYFQDFNQNWGDAVNPWILGKLTGRRIISAKKSFNITNKIPIYGIGSILNSNLNNSVIWGSGFIKPPLKIEGIPKKILAVRGHLTGEILRANGISHEGIYGDPALLMPELYNPDITKTFKLGIIPHYTELESLKTELKLDERIKIISPLVKESNFTDIIDQIKECENILSSSLHGLILADAYGIPSLKLKFGNKIIGGNFKFQDYYSGVNIKNYEEYYFKTFNDFDLEDVLKKTELKRIEFNSTALRNSTQLYTQLRLKSII